MQNLINELLNPATNEAGETIPASTVKRRAAQAIAHLHATGQADLQARLILQAKLEAYEADPYEGVNEYKRVMNDDYHANYT